MNARADRLASTSGGEPVSRFLPTGKGPMDKTQALLIAASVILTLFGVIGGYMLSVVRSVYAKQLEQDKTLTRLETVLLGLDGVPGTGFAAELARTLKYAHDAKNIASEAVAQTEELAGRVERLERGKP